MLSGFQEITDTMYPLFYNATSTKEFETYAGIEKMKPTKGIRAFVVPRPQALPPDHEHQVCREASQSMLAFNHGQSSGGRNRIGTWGICGDGTILTLKPAGSAWPAFHPHNSGTVPHRRHCMLGYAVPSSRVTRAYARLFHTDGKCVDIPLA